MHDTTTLAWSKRCPLLATLIKASGASVVCLQEVGTQELADLLSLLPGWTGRKAAGLNDNGLNAVIWRNDWTLEKFDDWDLPSFGQMQRTLIVCTLMPTPSDRQIAPSLGATVRIGSTHFAATAPDLTREQANAAKLAQVQEINRLLTGDVILGLDFARTDAGDDEDYLRANGWQLPGRDTVTPELVMVKGDYTVVTSKTIPAGKATDHDARLLTVTT